MKLAHLILPEAWHIRPAHLWLQNEIAKRWKGYTAMPNQTGYWEDGEGNAFYEQVTVYMVAMERADAVHLRDMAAEVARLGEQQCVMIVTPNGDVEFVKPAKNKSPEALDAPAASEL